MGAIFTIPENDSCGNGHQQSGESAARKKVAPSRPDHECDPRGKHRCENEVVEKADDEQRRSGEQPPPVLSALPLEQEDNRERGKNALAVLRPRQSRSAARTRETRTRPPHQ